MASKKRPREVAPKSRPPRTKARPSGQAALAKIIESGITGKSGKRFFSNLAIALSEATNSDYVFIGTFAGKETRKVRTLGAAHRGRTIANFEYKLEGSPCETVFDCKPHVIKRGVRVLYPHNHVIAKWGIEGYVGTPLIDDGMLLGVIACFTKRPLRKPDIIVSVQGIFANRATTELVRELDRNVRKDVENRLLGVLNISDDAIISIDEDQRIGFFNRGAEHMFGYAPAEVADEKIDVLLPVRYRERHAKFIDGFRHDAEMSRMMSQRSQVVGLRKNGIEFSAEASISKYLVDGRCYMTVVMRDISEREKTQAALRQAQKMEAIGQLAGGIAHDFNNLLSVVLGSLEHLEGTMATDGENHAILDRAISAVKRGAALNQQLLAFARRQPLDPRPCNANKLIPSVVDMIRRLLGESIEIETVLGAGLWLGMFDPVQLENALVNLAINARDAMPQGGKLTFETANAVLDRAYVEKAPGAKVGQYVVIAVSDTGMGIAKENLDRIFDPFFTTKPAGKGTGLGLSMVYGFVKQSEGHIRAYSEHGQGTTIRIYLPRTEASNEENQEVSAARTSITSKPGETVLVVEDDPDVRDVVTMMLSNLGYDVVAVEDGIEMLRIMDTMKRVDLLFTDVMLPHGMTGRAVADKLLERFPKAKILFTSGYAENAIMHHGRLDKGTHLLGKPYSRSELAKRVRDVLDDP